MARRIDGELGDPHGAALWEVVRALRAERRLREQRHVAQRLLLALAVTLTLTGCALAVVGSASGPIVLLVALAMGKLSISDERRD